MENKALFVSVVNGAGILVLCLGLFWLGMMIATRVLGDKGRQESCEDGLVAIADSDFDHVSSGRLSLFRLCL